MHILLGKWTEGKLDCTLQESARIKDIGARIDFLSRHFIGVEYKESTLSGDVNTPEVFVINLSAVDCFTFLDYIEAMRLSGSFSEFEENLKRVRYRKGRIAYKNRTHFFTDWREYNSEFIDDVTRQIGSQRTKTVIKILNKREDGTYLLTGIQPEQREIHYIPSGAINSSVIHKIKTGDYAGIYSEKHGLDVSHVGIIIKEGDLVYLRHASSEKRKVVEQDFIKYMINKPGLIVLRAK